MIAPSSQKKPVRYMDFVSHKPRANADPLASRPASVSAAKKPKPVAKPRSVSDQIPPKITDTELKPKSEIRIKREETKPYISRQPAKSRDLYPEPKSPQLKTDDDLAIKASAALSGASKPATASAPDNNAYSLGGKSPFLPNYTIDKRPLSDSVPTKNKDTNFEKLSFLGVSDDTPTKPKKNVYEKKTPSDPAPSTSKTVRIIDDTKQKHGIPVALIILLTIIFGAAVGAGVYFLLPK